MSDKWTNSSRIARLRDKKLRDTAKKQDYFLKNIDKERLGLPQRRMDMDDHAQILPPDGFKFEIIPNHVNGGCYGAEYVGMNFRRLLECHPVCVDPDCSMAGAWMVWFQEDYRKITWNPDYDYSHLVPEQKKYNIIHGIGGYQHFNPDPRIGLKLGFGGLLEKIRYYRNLNGETDDKFYQASEDTVLGIQNWISRNIAEAWRLAESEMNPDARSILEKIALNNEKIMNEPPKTFYEACQWLVWYNLAATIFNCSGATGALDDYLLPYYEKDVREGILDDEEAIFHIACMYHRSLKYTQIGGTKPDGTDRTNRLSFLILEAVRRLKAPAEMCIRIHENMDFELLRKGVQCLFENKMGYPNFIGHKGITEGFMRNGYSAELARQRAKCGCNWCALPGIEYTLNDVIKINFAKIFDVAIREMFFENADNPNTDLLWSYFMKHLERAVDVTIAGIDFHFEHMHKVCPELVLNLLCEGPIEKGLDITNGGVEYYNIGIDGVALATVADSLASIKQKVELEKAITWNELKNCIENNYSGMEELRQILMKVDKYGSGDSIADEYAKKIVQLYVRIVKGKKTAKGYNLIPGLFSWASTITMGKEVGATPNGRFAYTPVSFGANPDPGFTSSGAPTSMALALASVQCGYGNTVPLQLDLDPDLGFGEEAVDKFVDYLKAYCSLGGTLINVNIFDAEKILDAHKDPSKYPELIVRVTGFSAYFSSLSKEFRQLTVDRIVKG